MIARLIDFITTDIWRIRLQDTPRSKSFFLKQLRIVILAVRGFDEDRCHLACALTFYSLLSIVPVIAILFGIAKGFGFQEMLEKELLEKFSAHQAVLVQVMDFAKSLLETTRGGLIAGIGLAVLFWTVIKVLGSIERSFNNVWGVKTPRPWSRKFTDYISVLLIAPILFLLSSSIMVFITSQVTFITEKFALLGVFSPLFFPPEAPALLHRVDPFYLHLHFHAQYQSQVYLRFGSGNSCRQYLSAGAVGIHYLSGGSCKIQCYLWEFCGASPFFRVASGELAGGIVWCRNFLLPSEC